WRHFFDVGLVGAIALPDLLGTALLRGLAIFGSNRGGIDQLLGVRRYGQTERNEQHSNNFQNSLLKKIPLNQASFQTRWNGANHPAYIEASPMPDHAERVCSAAADNGGDDGGAQ